MAALSACGSSPPPLPPTPVSGWTMTLWSVAQQPRPICRTPDESKRTAGAPQHGYAPWFSPDGMSQAWVSEARPQVLFCRHPHYPNRRQPWHHSTIMSARHVSGAMIARHVSRGCRLRQTACLEEQVLVLLLCGMASCQGCELVLLQHLGGRWAPTDRRRSVRGLQPGRRGHRRSI
jgi:hypothetical protein